ncbi:MAG: 3-deoxy-7-phosphoheptulonate synthase [Burkholderiales bacterium]|uniref:3-deoxy-7-phosphoheptulonate synthase n=1 Tax=Nitrosomonas sp. TaxID=42353 RepID=UPI001E0A7835|nr:3-deoxy-7-phosphoheptulonate synthase [Nitrosomonas sp.]MCB1949060.1 3-deoxy-7-phosphoheptulonate synthase [Nitrosomonas sp.]MCP5242117.1 3-deoxy-7-phosphoheptulonate synthase [Burkholderiales bacterium]
MIIVMNKEVTEEQIGNVIKKIQDLGHEVNISRGTKRIVIGAIGDETKLDPEIFDPMPGVEYSMHIVKQYKIVSRESHQQDSVIDVRGIPVGGNQIQVIGGPCSVETQTQMDLAAKQVSSAGCRLMRGGAFKPRTSPYTFQGKGRDGLGIFRAAADKYNLPIVTELMDVRMLDTFLEHDVDVIQIGTRNMQNFDLLKEVGRIQKPVILKRGLSATVTEWLMAAEYIAAGGNHNIIFCERGIRTFETAYRNVLDVTCVPMLKRETHLPVIIDPSHAGGKAWMVPSLARAAIAAGADGLLVEMHPNPCEAWCDADQALNPQEFTDLMSSLRGIAQVIGRTF